MSQLKRSLSQKKLESGNLSLRRAMKGSLTRSISTGPSQQDVPGKLSAFVDKNGNPCEVSVALHTLQKQELGGKGAVARPELLKNPRYRIIKEIKDSERTYFTFLQSVAMLFYQPCKQAVSTTNPILEQSLMEDIFGNILDIADLSSQVLQAFEIVANPKVWDGDTTIGDVFFELLEGDLPKAYEEYVSGYGKRLKALANTPEQFNLFRKNQEGSQLCGNHTLSSLLITPIQRIPRYILLLRDLLRHTPTEHEDKILLPKASAELEKLAAKLDESKKKADTRDQFSLLLSSLQKKCSDKLAQKIETQDIEAAGEIIEFADSQFVPVFCFLFSDMLIGCTVKKEMVSKIQWIIDLNSAHLSATRHAVPAELQRKLKITDNCIIITELRPIDKEPYSTNFSLQLFPGKPPYDMGFWYNSILTVVTSLWFDQKVLLSNSDRFIRHIEKHLFPSSQWKLIQLAGSTETFKSQEIIVCEGTPNKDFFIIKEGQVKIVKPTAQKQLTLGRLKENDFFGEFSYVAGRDSDSAATIIADGDTTICRVPFVTLTNILLSDPGMMYRFFRFQCCIMANRLVLQLFTRINSNEVQKKRKGSRNLQQELLKIASDSDLSHLIRDSNSEKGYESEGNSVSNGEEDKSTKEETKEEEEESEELYIPHQMHAPLVRELDALTKKYRPQLAKKVPFTEQVLAEIHVNFKRFGKNDQKGKFLFLDHYICIIYRKGFANKAIVIEHEQIGQILENENQHMLVIIIPGSVETPELQCVFDTHSDYCKTNSLLQNMSKKQNKESSADFFEGIAFSDQEWEYFLSLTRTEHFEKGSCLIKIGTTTQTVYRVEKGTFQIQTTLDSGANHPIVVGAGAIFGDLTFLQGGVSSADIIANSNDCEVICFDKEVIDDLSQINPLLVGKFYRMLAADMVDRFLTVQNGLLT